MWLFFDHLGAVETCYEHNTDILFLLANACLFTHPAKASRNSAGFEAIFTVAKPWWYNIQVRHMMPLGPKLLFPID